MRRTHEERVLAALRVHGAMSRGDLAARVGLSRTTLSDITAQLLHRGAIVVADTDASTREGSGRPAERLALDPDSGQFLGVDFGHRRVNLVVADAAHEVIAQGIAQYEDGAPWSERISRTFERIERLSRETGVHFGAIQAIGIGVPGPYNSTRFAGPVVNYKGQAEPDGVEAAFVARFSAPVMVDNNTRLAALAEAITRPDAVDNLLYVRLSDGVGGGLVVSGRLATGSRGYAGELGHVTADPNGQMCRCGKRGCLETVASTPAILRACRAAGADANDLGDLEAAVTKGDPHVETVLREVGATIGRVLGSASMVLDPREVVIAGDIVHVAPVLVEAAATALKYELHTIASDQPRIVRAGYLRDDDGALGAIAAIFHQSPLLAEYPDVSPGRAPIPKKEHAMSARTRENAAWQDRWSS